MNDMDRLLRTYGEQHMFECDKEMCTTKCLGAHRKDRHFIISFVDANEYVFRKFGLCKTDYITGRCLNPMCSKKHGSHMGGKIRCIHFNEASQTLYRQFYEQGCEMSHRVQNGSGAD